MNETLQTTIAGMGGFALGTLYFTALWWTVVRLPSTRHPAPLMFGSYALRIIMLFIGIVLLSRFDWRRIIACLAGLLVARLTVCRTLEHLWN